MHDFNSMLHTALLVGDLGDKRRDQLIGFGLLGGPSLSYESFRDEFNIQSPDLGSLDEGNLFFKTFSPTPPPSGDRPSNASSLAAELIDGLPCILREIAESLVAVDKTQKNVTNKYADPDDKTVYLDLVGRVLQIDQTFDENSSAELRKKWFGKSQPTSDQERHKQEEKVHALENAISGINAGDNSRCIRDLCEHRGLFQVLLRQHILDAADAVAERTVEDFGSKLKNAGIEPLNDKVIDLTDQPRKCRLIASLVRRNAELLHPNDMALKDRKNRSKAFEIWTNYVKYFEDLARSSKLSDDVITRNIENAEKTAKIMSDRAKLLLRIEAIAMGGGAYLTEATTVGLLYNAIVSMVQNSEGGAQAEVTEARRKGEEWHKTNRDLSDEQLAKAHGDALARRAPEIQKTVDGSESTRKGQEIASMVANLVRVAVTTRDQAIKSQIFDALLLAVDRELNSKIVGSIESQQYASLVRNWSSQVTGQSHASNGAEVAKPTSAESKDEDAIIEKNETIIMAETGDASTFSASAVKNGQLSSMVSAAAADVANDQQEGRQATGPRIDLAGENAADRPSDKSDAGAARPAPESAKKVAEDAANKRSSIPETEGLEREKPAPEPAIPVPAEQKALREQEEDLLKTIINSAQTQQLSDERVKELLVDFHSLLHEAFVKLGPGTGSDESTRSSRLAAQQYLLIIMLLRHGIKFGDPSSGAIGWLLRLAQYGSAAEALKKIPLSDFIKCDNGTNLHEEYDAVHDKYKEAIRKCTRLLSNLYGARLLFRSAADGNRKVYVWNGSAEGFLEKYPNMAEFDPIRFPGMESSIPLCIYFVYPRGGQAKDTIVNKLPGVAGKCVLSGRPLPICIFDAGPDFDSGEPWIEKLPTTSDLDARPYVTLVGPGLRLRDRKANDGRGNIPLIPGGYLLTAALIDGTATVGLRFGEEMATFPEIKLPEDAKIRVELKHGDRADQGVEAIELLNRAIGWEKSSLAADVFAWACILWIFGANEANTRRSRLKQLGFVWPTDSPPKIDEFACSSNLKDFDWPNYVKAKFIVDVVEGQLKKRTNAAGWGAAPGTELANKWLAAVLNGIRR